MARKRKILPEFENVTIDSVAAEGKSIARIDEMVVFIPYGAPGDVVNVKLDKKKKNYGIDHGFSYGTEPYSMRRRRYC